MPIALIYQCGLLAVGIFSFFLAVLVYLKAYQQPKNEAFIVVTIATGLWSLTLFVFHQGFDQPYVFWLSLSQLIAIFIPVAFIHFVFALLGLTQKRKKGLIAFYIIALVLGSFNFTPLFISSIKYNPLLGYYHLVPGPVYKAFTLAFVAMVAYGCFLLARALKQSSGFRRNEIRYYFIGFIMGFVGGGTTFVPLYNISILPAGIFLLLAGEVVLAYAILKRQLMDIRTVVSKGLIYSTVTIVVFALFVLIGFKITSYYQFPSGYNFRVYLYILGFCLFLVLILNPLRRKMEQLVESLIFKRAHSSYKELRKGSQKLLTILDNKTLCKYFPQTVIQATDASWGALWLFDERRASYYLQTKIGERKDSSWQTEGLFLNKNAALLNLMRKEKRPLLREEIYPFLKGENGNSIEEKLRESDFSLVIPLFFEGSVKGCLFLGEKRTGALFSSYELQALTLFSDQAAIAFTNAQLFQQVQRMKEYSERIVNNVDNGLIVINEEGKIATFNRKIEEMIGLSCNEVIGKSPQVLPSPLDEIITKSWKNKKPIYIPEFSLEIGQEGPLTVSLGASFMDKKQAEGEMIVVMVDITEVKKLEEKIRQTEKMASIGSMVSQLAHEIKNPLSSIKTFTELLPEKFQDEEFRRSFFSVVSKEINRIDDLITRMLNLGRADKTQYRKVSVQQVITDAISSLRFQLQERNIKVNLTHKEVFPMIWADPQSLREVFSNILINSIQAMPLGGNIDISLGRRKDKDTGKDLLKISITDEGGGIPKKYLNRIFDPFFTTKSKGSGLGLYICYQIIQSYEGEIKVKNTGSGANFTILLPVSENSIPFEDEKRRVYG